MARHLFGGIAEFVVAPGDEVTVGSITGNETLLVPAATITFWNAATAGSQYDDLQDLTGTAIDHVVSDSTGAFPQFKGPDNIALMYADAGGSRRAVVAIDLGADVAANASVIATLAAAIDALAAVATTGAYADLSGVPALADVATSGAYADLSGTPAPGLQVVVKVGGSWPPRNTSAPDVSRIAEWIGPAPAPPATSGYALAGDLWTQTVA